MTATRVVSSCCAPIAVEPIGSGDASKAAGLFAALGDPARVRIVNLLSTAADAMCVCDITGLVGLSQPTVSFHLKKLLGAGLVVREQRGKWAHYSMRPGALSELSAVLRPKEVTCG
jgi:ArsR family transcriptional regulator